VIALEKKVWINVAGDGLVGLDDLFDVDGKKIVE
jgi:hypothetical protein